MWPQYLITELLGMVITYLCQYSQRVLPFKVFFFGSASEKQCPQQLYATWSMDCEPMFGYTNNAIKGNCIRRLSIPANKS